MDIDTNSLEVADNPEAHAFEIRVEGQLALVAYRKREGSITYTHTEVPEALEGHGIAGKLAKHALDYARANGLRVVPQCPYVKAYIARHPEYQDLLR